MAEAPAGHPDPAAPPVSVVDLLPPRFIGRRVPRKEDRRLVTGTGRYVADLHLAGMLHAAILRSSFAHAAIPRIETKAAAELDGVVAVITGEDLRGRMAPLVEAAREEVSHLLEEKVGPVVKSCAQPVLAEGEVFWVGQPIAVVVARDRYTAEDALERIEVEYDPLPALADPEEAIADGAPILHPQIPENVAAHFVVQAGDVDRAFAQAAHTMRERFEMGRMAGNAMETRGIVASFDRGKGELTVWVANARPHLVRRFITEQLGLRTDSVRVIAPDMGGSFGTGMFAEEVLIPFLAMELGEPVRWVEDRRENLAVTRHARDQIHDIEVAYDDDGRILAIRDRYLVDSGAYNQYAITVSYNTAAHLRGQYRIDTFLIEARNVLTNKAPVTPVRGAGRPEAVFAMDGCLERIASDLGLDPIEVRRRNLIQPEAMPYPMGMPYRDGVDMVYDGGDFPAQLDKALDVFGYGEWRAKQQEAKKHGGRLGIGVSSYVEGSGYGPHEGAVVRVDATGSVWVYTGAKPHGQSLETTLAQICADQLGIEPDRVTVQAGDTGAIEHGVGTFASRSAVTAGNAVGIAAGQVRKKVLAVGGELLEVDPTDLEIEEGVVFARGAPGKSVTFEEIARAAVPGPRSRLPAGMEPGLQAEHYFVPPTVTFGSGTHIVAVRVDEETGFVELLRYVTVDDCGRMLNPMIVEGQIHGGVVHGIGNALFEEAVYDDQGQLLTGTYMDYLLTTSAEAPPITVGHQEILSPLNPLGVKGCGEGGAVSPPAAIAAAIMDALRPLRVGITRMPLSPERLYLLILEAKQREEQRGD